MNLLLVDDELHIVQGIQDSLHWDEMGIERVFTAYSMAQAMNVFQQEHIDILLADIEMPKGTGLDLLEWAQQHGHRPVTLFLTSHAKFEYAQKAMQMQSIGYILKPADTERLESELRRAVMMIQKEAEQVEMRSLAEAWTSQVDSRLELFWSELIQGKIPLDPSGLTRLLDRRHLPNALLSAIQRCILVRVAVLPEGSHWARELLDYAIRNILSEVLGTDGVFPMSALGEDQFLLVLPDVRFSSDALWFQACEDAAQACERSLPAEIAVFLSSPCGLTDIPKQCAALRQSAYQHPTRGSLAVSGKMLTPCSPQEQLPAIPLDDWTEALLTHNGHVIREDIAGIFKHPRAMYQRSQLESLYHAVLQVIYTALEKRNVASADMLVESSESASTTEAEATRTVAGFLKWTEEILAKAGNRLASHKMSGSIVENVRRIVQSRLMDEDLSRSGIAAEIHLNPDYLSTVYKEKTGESLTAYIAGERIRLARKLLLSTDLPIRDIAMQTGFTDLAYFSRQFKHLTGWTPQQYRKSGM